MAGDHGPTKKSILRVLVILGIITIVELASFYVLREPLGKGLFNTMMISMSLLKCFYIVGEFMHMKYELKQFVFYTLVTVTLLFWFVGAILWEGSWWNGVRFIEGYI